MGGALESETRKLFEALDRKDTEAIISASARDIQGVDEISRRWLRGSDALAAYLGQLAKMVDHIHTTISDVHETAHGDSGLVTCWMEQEYVLEGRPQHVSAPTTVAFRREGGAWKIVLFHAVPLPPDSSSPN
jgi:ketosteroid isomerase-like protein